MKLSYLVGDATCTVEVFKTADGYRAILDGQEYAVRLIQSRDGEIAFTIGDRTERAYYALEGVRRWVCVEGNTYVLTATTPGSARRPSGGAHAHFEQVIRAPMPGHVRAVLVSEGDTITKGQTLIVLEAMKMEIRVQAPRSGKLKRLRIKEGDQVEREQVLGEID